MEKRSAQALVVFILLIISMQSCVRDTLTTTYSYTMYTPVYKTKEQVRENIKSNVSQSLQNTGKLYIFGSYIFLNEVDKGIHVIDNANPAQPKTVAFIDIPGNRDLAVRGNTLYADLYTDLVAIDISNPANVQLKKVVENVFPHRFYDAHFTADTFNIIVGWTQRDTVITTKESLNSWLKQDRNYMAFSNAVTLGGGSIATSSPIGMGGSMARFAIANQMLYTVGLSDMKVFNITEAFNPNYINSKSIGMSIETIFPFQNKLFIGSQNGMYIYDISNPSNPVQQGQFSHVRSCDPVIADQSYAYVTLRSGTQCQGFTNQLEVLSISNLNSPSLIKTYPMSNPHGLSKDGNVLFICDGAGGLKVYNAADVNNLQLIKKVEGIETYDVIAWNKTALVVAKDGLYQYDYTNTSDIRLISKINITK